MKKLLALVAIATAIPLVAVESANIVGYNTKNLEAGKWYLIAAGFQDVNGESLSLNKFLTGLTAGVDATDSPTIQYWDGSQLKTLIYVDGVYDPDEDDFVVAWADLGLELATVTPNPGFGCWIKVPTATSITIAGQVVAAETKDLSITTAWQLVGNPYPIALDFNSGIMDCSALSAGTDATDSPTIQYWDGTQLKTLIYVDGVYDPDEDDFVVAWADLGLEKAATTLDPCTGFWIKAPSAGTITWKK